MTIKSLCEGSSYNSKYFSPSQSMSRSLKHTADIMIMCYEHDPQSRQDMYAVQYYFNVKQHQTFFPLSNSQVLSFFTQLQQLFFIFASVQHNENLTLLIVQTLVSLWYLSIVLLLLSLKTVILVCVYLCMSEYISCPRPTKMNFLYEKNTHSCCVNA